MGQRRARQGRRRLQRPGIQQLFLGRESLTTVRPAGTDIRLPAGIGSAVEICLNDGEGTEIAQPIFTVFRTMVEVTCILLRP